MKKKLLFATIILVLLAGVLYYISLPDYLVFNSMSFSNGANRDTELQVIVYQYWNTDEVVAEIEAEHNQINGTPTILTINLYHSKWSFHVKVKSFAPRQIQRRLFAALITLSRKVFRPWHKWF